MLKRYIYIYMYIYICIYIYVCVCVWTRIGCDPHHQACLECIAKTSTVAPHVNQIQLHVGMGPDADGLPSYGES
jgi:hypothetical protein